MLITRDSASMYRSWNYTTACCFKYKTDCKICPNKIVCAKYTKPVGNYYIHPVKYATLKTYANIGLEGYESAFANSENKINGFLENRIEKGI